MRNSWWAIALCAIGLAATGCGGGGNSAAPTTAAVTFPADEQAALDSLAGACVPSTDYPKMDAEAKAANVELQKGGINDETTTSVLVHLRQSIPAGAPKTMQCSEILADYVVLRIHGDGNSGGG